VKVVGPYTFRIEDTTGYGTYVTGGIMRQEKQKKTVSFKSLRESLQTPEILFSDFAKFDRPMQLHLGFQALQAPYQSAASRMRTDVPWTNPSWRLS